MAGWGLWPMGFTACRLVLGLLLGADGGAVCSRGDESGVDGVRRCTNHTRETLPWGRAATWGTAAVLLVLAILVVAAPHAVPGLVVPGGSGGAMQTMDAMQ